MRFILTYPRREHAGLPGTACLKQQQKFPRLLEQPAPNAEKSGPYKSGLFFAVFVLKYSCSSRKYSFGYLSIDDVHSSPNHTNSSSQPAAAAISSPCAVVVLARSADLGEKEPWKCRGIPPHGARYK